MSNKQPSPTRELSLEKVSEEGETKLMPAASRQAAHHPQDREILTHSCQCCSSKCDCTECLDSVWDYFSFLCCPCSTVTSYILKAASH
ncbi:hypothetical protein D9619_002618 [Psilocybe cf. subviscida]|uniref:Uncharacterized protein n=1 Tax=Psilocybe cf. subviscida TaxID=2480587 RepID=A0A8H5AX14_9AGAR|nr:hypothetical protein D9619_002618 [Psilocybe cf. subviscida]